MVRLTDWFDTTIVVDWDAKPQIKQTNQCPITNNIIEPRHEISNNVVCATSKGSDQPAHTRSLIRAIAGRLNIL